MTTEQHPEIWCGRLRAVWAVLDALHDCSSERLLSHHSQGREILVLTVLCKGAVQEKKEYTASREFGAELWRACLCEELYEYAQGEGLDAAALGKGAVEDSSDWKEKAEEKEVVGRVRIQSYARPQYTEDGEGTAVNGERNRGRKEGREELELCPGFKIL